MSEPRRHERMPQRCDDVALEDQVRAVRTEYADEEAEAAEMEQPRMPPHWTCRYRCASRRNSTPSSSNAPPRNRSHPRRWCAGSCVKPSMPAASPP
jgi:hypothetical protein